MVVYRGEALYTLVTHYEPRDRGVGLGVFGDGLIDAGAKVVFRTILYSTVLYFGYYSIHFGDTRSGRAVTLPEANRYL